MIYQILGKFVWLATGFLIVPLGVIPRADAQSAQDPAGQLMLLKNGSVLQGFIERTANHYTIQTRPGNRLHLPFEKVEVIADSYSEIYWRRLTTIGAADSAEHEALFHWCLRYRLWDEAANQLEILKAIASDESILRKLERQLANALVERDRQQGAAAKAAKSFAKQAASHHAATQATSSQSATNRIEENHAAANQVASLLATDPANQTATNQSTSQANVDVSVAEINQENQSSEFARNFGGVTPAGNESFFENFEPVFNPLPSVFDAPKRDSIASSEATDEAADRVVDEDNEEVDSQVRQVGFEEAGGEESAAEPLLILSVRELEQFIKTLPKNSFAQFRSRVEPILISKCSDCHQKGGHTNDMPLMLRSKRMPVTIRMSQRNLVSAIKYVDAANPDVSSLLKASATAHGNQESASLTGDSVDFQALKDWIGLVTNAANAVAQNTDPNSNETPIANDSLSKLGQTTGEDSKEPGKMLEPLSAQNLPSTARPLQAISADRRVSAPRPIEIRHSPNLGKLEPLPPTVGEIPSLSEPAERFVPRDEFDPEIFNRQFGTASLGKGN